MIDPKQYYKAQQLEHRNILKVLQNKELYLFIARLLSGFSSLSLLIWGFYTKSIELGLGGVISLLLFIICVYWYKSNIKKIKECKQILKAVNNELLYFKGEFTAYNGKDYVSAQHPFTYDIDIFGESSLFHRINRTITQSGSKQLASLLSNVGCGKHDILQRQATLDELEKQHDYLIHHKSIAEIEGKKIHFSAESYSSIFNIRTLSIIISLSLFILISCWSNLFVCLFLGKSLILPIYILASIIFINGLISTFYFQKGNKIILKLKQLISLSESYAPIISLNTAITFKSNTLKEIQSALLLHKKSLKELSTMNEFLGFRNNVILWMVSNTLFLLDVFIFIKFIKWEKKNLSKLHDLEDTIGHLDALISLATYNFNHPNAVTPQIVTSGCISGKNIYHPFMAFKEAIGNNFTQEESIITIITGANMSGKSTFLRTIALNIVLANTGCKVCAESFLLNASIKLFTSMRTQDNIVAGKSYFNAEIDRLESAIDYGREHPSTLFIFDEVLKGTNSEDKLLGSINLLKFFSQKQFMVIIATHDLGVTHLEEEFGSDKYINYCFEIELTTPILYSYTINRGVCKNKNASFIVNKMLESKIKMNNNIEEK